MTTWTVEMAEAFAARFGMQVAYKFGFTNIILESDSLAICIKISNNAVEKFPIFVMLDDIQRYASMFEGFYICHVKRGGNCLAHFIVHESMDLDAEKAWFDPFPQSLCNLVDYNLI
ncbi:Hydroxyethylthiazole kinase [Bienertia sinuspersici]